MKKIMHNSRKQWDFLMRAAAEGNLDYYKHFIAACNVNEFLQFVHITKFDEKTRTVEYEIRLPEEK